MSGPRRYLMAGGGFSPPGVPGLRMWFDASVITGLSNGDTVSTWEDLSTYSYDLTASATPAYTTGVQNGLPIVRYLDADNDYHRVNLTGWTTNEFSMFIVAGGSPLDGCHLVDVGEAGAARCILQAIPGPRFFLRNNASSVKYLTGFSSYGPMRLYSMVATAGSTARAWENGVLVDTDTAPSAPWGSGNAFRLNGNLEGDIDLAEVLVYSSAVSDGDRADLTSYLIDKWGL